MTDLLHYQLLVKSQKYIYSNSLRKRYRIEQEETCERSVLKVPRIMDQEDMEWTKRKKSEYKKFIA